MRLVITGVISTALILANATTLAASETLPNDTGHGIKTIHGMAQAKHFNAPSSGNFYVQAGTFKSAKNAAHYQQQLMNTYHHPVMIKTEGRYHVVVIGPIHSATEVRALHQSTLKTGFVKKESAEPILERQLSHMQPRDVGDKDAAIAPAGTPSHFEVLGAVGIANLRADDGTLGVTSSETDRLIQTDRNDWDSFTGQVGIGYVYYFPGKQQYSESTQWFPAIEPEINGYYIAKDTLKGDVWRFGDANFNQMTFKMPVQSTRLMFDTALTIVSKKQYSLYAIGGIGGAWNKASYRDADRNGLPCVNQALQLNSASHSDFSWEAGAGFSYAFNNRISLSLEYLYTDLGDIRNSAHGSTGTITTPVIIPAHLDLSAQSALLGLHIAI